MPGQSWSGAPPFCLAGGGSDQLYPTHRRPRD